MRKLIIGLVSMAFVAFAFWIYIEVMDPPPIDVDQGVSDVDDMVIPEKPVTETPPAGPQEMGDPKIGNTGVTKYVVLDPVTKQVQRVLGFEKLLNPGENVLHLQEPYMVFSESKYECRIDSKSGRFQMESLERAAPKDGKLDGQVVIHITPKEKSRMSETFIYMDDLTFSSERSEFATNGPVKIVSDQVQMDGFGLILIFDTKDGRVDYMHIRDLESLRLKNVASSDSPLSPDKDAKDTPAAAKRDVAKSDAAVASADDTAVDAEITQKQPKSSDYYQCLIEDNVLIQYGDELVVAGADQVSIQNILPKQSQDSLFGGDAQTKTVDKSEQSSAVSHASAKQPEQVAKTDSDKPSDDQEKKDILITCDGGIIFKPVDGVINAQRLDKGPELAMEMSGTPLRIERSMPDDKEQFETLAHCGLLTYTPKEDILRMFRQTEPQIVLNAQDSNSRIETLGDIAWNRKTQQANILGPGTVYIHDSNHADRQPSEVEFDGMMDLLFASLPDNKRSASIQSINLTGGMNATLKQNGWYKTTADEAKLDFGPENSLSQARLQGGVEFKSLQEDKPQRAVSDSAVFKFGPENSLDTAHMEGGVLFESTDKDKQSRALADNATFHFDDNKIQMADLQGAVSFASDTGKITASDAQIEFKPDAAGTMKPGVVHTTGQAILQTISDSPDKRPARFEAQKIDYDLQTGSGLAHGPIQFTFYQPASENSTMVNPYVPVTITADENAQFLADDQGNINQVVFNGNVVAFRVCNKLKYQQRDQFHGEKLIVDIAENAQGKLDVSKIVIKEGDVYAESILQNGDQTLSNVVLNCQVIIYGQSEDRILALGPGSIELVNNQKPDLTDPSLTETEKEFRQPCVARLKDFEEIHWDLAAHEIRADGKEETMKLAYVPLVEGRPEKYLYVSSRQIDASFQEDATGGLAIKRVFTDKGISFIEKDSSNKKITNEIVGQTLEYNADNNDWLKISGSSTTPCLLNNIRTPAVWYNLKTGDANTSLSTQPGYFKSSQSKPKPKPKPKKRRMG
ncbi:MAG: hypothetical protein ACYTET_03220 [Planctomycetota bacterium]|jgi:hypothetical protein